MNIQHLRTFVAVVERGSFSEAARALGISQPAVTMQIQSLESDVAATLLDRRYRKVDLTEAGRVLLPHARAILSQVDAARDEIETLAGTVTGRLTLAASTTPGQYVLPRLLGGFLAANPEVGVELRVHDTAEVIEAVESGRANLGVTGARVSGARVEYEPFVDDELVMICHPDDPLAGREVLGLSELTSAAFIMRESGSGTRMVLEDLFRAEGVDPGELRVVMELGTSEAIVSAVEGGMGVGVVSRYVAHRPLADGAVALVREGHFPVVRPLYLVVPRGTLTRASSALLAVLRAQAPA